MQALYPMVCPEQTSLTNCSVLSCTWDAASESLHRALGSHCQGLAQETLSPCPPKGPSGLAELLPAHGASAGISALPCVTEAVTSLQG